MSETPKADGDAGNSRGEDKLIERARRCLALHPHFRGTCTAIELEFRDETLTIHGLVSTYFEKQLIQEAFHDIPEIRHIVNQVSVGRVSNRYHAGENDCD